MGVSSVKLWQRIASSQLASSTICSAWAADVASRLSATDALDDVKVAQHLVEQGRLTQFQADTLLAGSDQALVEHGHRLLEPVDYPTHPAPDVRSVFSGWWVATKSATAAPRWCRWLKAEELKQGHLAGAQPSLPRVLKHAQVQHANLQSVVPPQMAAGALQLALAPLEGKLLTAWCDGQPKSPPMVTAMLQDVAAGLAALHDVGLAHGRVTPDRICVSDTGRYQLLRDPLCALTLQLSTTDGRGRSPQGLLAQQLPDRLMSAHFMAPEFLAPAQPATVQSDLYSLGCAAWLLLVGQPPHQADRAEKILAAQAERLLAESLLGNLPEPLRLCLWHSLAKNPAVRFASARQLLQCLQEAQRIVAAGPQPPVGAAESLPPAPARAAPGKPPRLTVQPAVERGVRKPAAKRKLNRWLAPGIGGGALLALVLLLMSVRGGLGGSKSAQSQGTKNRADSQGSASLAAGGSRATPPASPDRPIDPRAEKFELVASDQPVLWAPPRVAEPLALELLPPGAQAFIGLRPAALWGLPASQQLLSLLEADMAIFWQWLSQLGGAPLEAIDRVVIAAYAGQGGPPQYAARVELLTPLPLSKLKASWRLTTELKVGQQQLLIADTLAYYIPQQPLVDSQSVQAFAVGPIELMRESLALQGTRGPLPQAMEQLWQSTDRQAQFNLLLSPPFLFTESRGWLEQAPAGWKNWVQNNLPRDTRAIMLTSSLEQNWYYELRMVGHSDRQAVVFQQKLSDWKDKLPLQVESWLVSELPHPHWRAMANRYPGMLRALGRQTRMATENGQAVANGYLPASAAANLVYASWMAVQPSASVPSATILADQARAPTAAALSPSQILDRVISLSTDPVGVEVVLALIAEQANDQLPPGTRPLKFELDGAAFQLAGFTRNFQVRDYKVTNQSVREALNLLVRKANPTQNVALNSAEQQMVWVLLHADQAEQAMVSLTSRESATAAGQTLPAEFVGQ